jgi:glycosyltransferase involved in cell wall biosynthesis
LQFAVTHPNYKSISTDTLFVKYNIDKPYFFCPNQVWAHKNHIAVLKAVKFLKDHSRNDVLVVFSGKEVDYRNPDFFAELKKYILENGIEGSVRFLGFIDREDQLQLMNNSISVIQPSLFEGWSTVIEDAKSMGQYVIASNLEVHQEQLLNNVVFFNPADATELVDIMKKLIDKPAIKTSNDYQDNINKFGKTFLEIAQGAY